MRDAREYVALAEERSGPLPRGVAHEYPWGDFLVVRKKFGAAPLLGNLETALTARGTPWPDKGIHYRLHPENVRTLSRVVPLVLSLANKYILDWGYQGFDDTQEALERAGIPFAGAGATLADAAAPSLLASPPCSFFSLDSFTSGIPPAWAATATRPGVALLERMALSRLKDAVAREKARGRIVVLSVHWGGNWGFEVAPWQRELAHAWIDTGVDVVHGHSSHHLMGFERYRKRLILYGCGDFINDYEGIGGHEEYFPEFATAFFVEFDAEGAVRSVRLYPFRIIRMRLNALASEGDAARFRKLLAAAARFVPFRVRPRENFWEAVW